MALAIKFQDMIDRREIRDYAELGSLGYVSRARVTQIMKLLNLAPQIQEEILFLPPAFGRGPATERHLRRLNSIIDWDEQTRLWGDLTSPVRVGSPPIFRVGSEKSDARLAPRHTPARRI